MDVSLPPALPAELHSLSGRSGTLGYYTAAPPGVAEHPPLLLVHSVNAAAGAHEVRPLFEHYRNSRAVYAPDLPGYGHSERSNRDYTPRLMTDAVLDLVELIQREHGDVPIDGLGVSLTSEFLSRAGTERPAAFRSLALVSPTALNRAMPRRGAAGTTRGMPWLLRNLQRPWLGKNLFRALASPASIRFFLRKTWGSKHIDESMFEYACLTTRQEGARYAPFYFLSGYLFSADAFSLYESLQQPVWMCHGVRGDFTDYRLKDHLLANSNWQCEVFDAGALPYFEVPDDFIASYDDFLDGIRD